MAAELIQQTSCRSRAIKAGLGGPPCLDADSLPLVYVACESNDRLRKTVFVINELEPEIEKLSDEQLRAKTDAFRERIA